ncbi:MAG: T9SS type A sorting domain-containing protein [Prevotella sp.]
MKKNKLLIAMIASMGVSNIAYGQSMLVVTPLDNNAEKLVTNIADIRKVSFGSGQMTITSNNGNVSSIAMNSVMSLKFTDDANFISALKDGKSTIAPYCNGEWMGVNGLNGEAKAIVCDTAGRIVMSLDRWNGSPVSIATLPKGVYILKVNDSSIKFTK